MPVCDFPAGAAQLPYGPLMARLRWRLLVQWVSTCIKEQAKTCTQVRAE